MSNEEFTHQNFWKDFSKFITVKEKSTEAFFISDNLFNKPFCKQVKDKKNDKAIRSTGG